MIQENVHVYWICTIIPGIYKYMSTTCTYDSRKYTCTCILDFKLIHFSFSHFSLQSLIILEARENLLRRVPL